MTTTPATSTTSLTGIRRPSTTTLPVGERAADSPGGTRDGPVGGVWSGRGTGRGEMTLIENAADEGDEHRARDERRGEPVAREGTAQPLPALMTALLPQFAAVRDDLAIELPRVVRNDDVDLGSP